MSLIEVFQDIKKYHKVLGYDYANMSFEERINNLRHSALALYQEVAELVDSTPWKPWRSVESQVDDRKNAAREIIDCIFFLGSIRGALEISPKALDEALDEAFIRNYTRIESGYNNDPQGRR